MSEKEAIDLMASSDSLAEWHANKKTVQQECPNYSDCWFDTVVMNGFMWTTLINRRVK